MTQRPQNVEPPLASRRVQLTLAILFILALAWLLLATWRLSSRPPQPIAAQFHGQAGESVLLRIDLNVAEPRELALLPRVGPVLATRIAENRRRLGHFASLDDLARVNGIGPKTLGLIREMGVVDPVSPAIHGGDHWASVRGLDDLEQTGSFDPASR